jgi:adhesin/invasin
LWFQATITSNDRLVISWLAPDSSTYLTVYPGLQPATNYCGLSTSFSIGNLPAGQLGAWQVRLYDNATELFSLPFTVTLPGAVTPTVGSVVNGASFKAGAPVAPGSLATVFGTGFAPQIYASTIPLPTELSGVSVIVNGRPAPIVFLNTTQINFEMPLETPAGVAKVVVETNGVPSASLEFQVQPVEPGLFVALNNKDGSANGAAHPASPGDFLVVYMTGQGPLSQPVFDGVPAPNPPPLLNATKPFSATIGPANANVTFLGLSPGFVGLAQADVQVPKLALGTYPLVITVGGVESNSISVTVK